MLPWLEAFIKSLRESNPDIPVVMIPYDRKCKIATELILNNGGSVLPESHELDELNSIGAMHFPGQDGFRYRYRKLIAMLNGPFDVFLFLDADIVVLENIEPLFSLCEDKLLTGTAHVVSFANDITHVYRPGNFRRQMLHEYGSVGFNTGHFISTSNQFTLDEIHVFAKELLPHVNEFAAHDQTFINYCFDRKYPKGIVSAFDLVPNLGRTWAGGAGPLCSPKVRKIIASSNPETQVLDRWVPFIHWAGYSKIENTLPYREVLNFYSSRT